MRNWICHVLIMSLWLFIVAATGKMNEFEDKILARIDEKFNALKTDILAGLKGHIKLVFWSSQRKN